MFKKVDGVMTYVPGDAGPCEVCGEDAKELQPYGPDNKKICIKCADADVGAVMMRMLIHLESVLAGNE